MDFISAMSLKFIHFSLSHCVLAQATMTPHINLPIRQRSQKDDFQLQIWPC